MFHYVHVHLGHLADKWRFVITPAQRLRDTILDYVLFGQGGTDTHYQTALDLTQQCLRIDCPTTIAGSHKAQNGHLACLFIDGNLGCLNAEAKGKVHVAPLSERPGFRGVIVVSETGLVPFVLEPPDNLRHSSHTAVGVHLPIFKANGIWRDIPALGRHGR